MEKKEIIAELLKNGATEIKNAKVRSVTVTPTESYTRVSLTIDKPARGMITKDNGITYEEGDTNIIYVSSFAIAAVLKDNDDAAFAANYLVEHPKSMEVILSRATIRIIQEDVKATTSYKNPWSSKENTTTFDHDTIISHVVDIDLSSFGLKGLEKIANKMLEI